MGGTQYCHSFLVKILRGMIRNISFQSLNGSWRQQLRTSTTSNRRKVIFKNIGSNSFWIWVQMGNHWSHYRKCRLGNEENVFRLFRWHKYFVSSFRGVRRIKWKYKWPQFGAVWTGWNQLGYTTWEFTNQGLVFICYRWISHQNRPKERFL